jgi:uncharacterized membrane protein
MERPRLTITSKPIDNIIEALGIAGLLWLLGSSVYFYASLPEIIPRHFNAYGQPDGYSRKEIIWTLPVLGSLLYAGMTLLSRYPHLFNYPQRVTQKNAAELYTLGMRLNKSLRTIIACLLAYMNHSVIQTSLGNQSGLGIGFTPVVLALIFGTIAYFLYQFSKIR